MKKVGRVKRSRRSKVGRAAVEISGLDVLANKPDGRAGREATQFKPGNPWRFKPGVSPNPGGRPKLLSEAFRQNRQAKHVLFL